MNDHLRILRVNMSKGKVWSEPLSEAYRIIGGRGLVAKIMLDEVAPDCDPLGPSNKLVLAAGPLAGTRAPQLGRLTVGSKSPLTLGIKRSNVGGPAAQMLDRLGIRAIVIEGAPANDRWYILRISADDAVLDPADQFLGMKNYELVDALHKKYGEKVATITIGIAGERRYKAASIAFSDIFGDPSRAAGRGGVGAVMGAKGLKAIIIDDTESGTVPLADPKRFHQAVKNWVNILRKDISCRLFHTFGTPLAVSTLSMQGAMPTRGYTLGRHEEFRKVSGEMVKARLWERGGRMHGCMPGCIVQCSIIYNGPDGRRLCSALEYEAIAMLGTNLDIVDLDAIARLKHYCDDIGLDIIETGGALSVAIAGGKAEMGDINGAFSLLAEIEEGTEFGAILGSGVVDTAKALGVSRVPAFKGQGIPGHDGRAAKGIGVTYATSPLGADHNAGLTYKIPGEKDGQIDNSIGAQIRAATCDTIGYCLNAVPGGALTLYEFFSELLNARYGLFLTMDDCVDIGKQTLRDEHLFNQRAEFSRRWAPYPEFYRTEPLPPTNRVFDIEDKEMQGFWDCLQRYKERKKVWEVRITPLPSLLIGSGVLAQVGSRAKSLKIKKTLFICDPVMQKTGRFDEVIGHLTKLGIEVVPFLEVKPDPPVEEIDELGVIYQKEGCDGIIGMGGGSSLDAAKALAVRVTHPGPLTEYESLAGGTAKIKGPLPPVICIPTTAGTGSEANTYAVITDSARGVKFIIMSELLVPRLAIIDPELAKTMPPMITAETGIDALAHCIEAYVGELIKYHPYYAALASYGVRLVGKSLIKAYENPDDTQARLDMAMAALYGGVAFVKGLGIGHALAHVLGARYHVPHGRGVAAGLLCFIRANTKACAEAFQDLAWQLERSADLEGALRRIYERLGLPQRLSELKVPEEDLPRLAFEASKDVVNLAGNPVYLDYEDILSLIKELY